MPRKSSYDCYDRRGPTSLNGNIRRRQLRQISAENETYARRLQLVRPVVDAQDTAALAAKGRRNLLQGAPAPPRMCAPKAVGPLWDSNGLAPGAALQKPADMGGGFVLLPAASPKPTPRQGPTQVSVARPHVPRVAKALPIAEDMGPPTRSAPSSARRSESSRSRPNQSSRQPTAAAPADHGSSAEQHSHIRNDHLQSKPHQKQGHKPPQHSLHQQQQQAKLFQQQQTKQQQQQQQEEQKQQQPQQQRQRQQHAHPSQHVPQQQPQQQNRKQEPPQQLEEHLHQHEQHHEQQRNRMLQPVMQIHDSGIPAAKSTPKLVSGDPDSTSQQKQQGFQQAQPDAVRSEVLQLDVQQSNDLCQSIPWQPVVSHLWQGDQDVAGTPDLLKEMHCSHITAGSGQDAPMKLESDAALGSDSELVLLLQTVLKKDSEHNDSPSFGEKQAPGKPNSDPKAEGNSISEPSRSPVHRPSSRRSEDNLDIIQNRCQSQSSVGSRSRGSSNASRAWSQSSSCRAPSQRSKGSSIASGARSQSFSRQSPGARSKGSSIASGARSHSFSRRSPGARSKQSSICSPVVRQASNARSPSERSHCSSIRSHSRSQACSHRSPSGRSKSRADSRSQSPVRDSGSTAKEDDGDASYDEDFDQESVNEDESEVESESQ